MKLLFITLTAISSFFAKGAFANDNPVAPVVLQSFEKSFNAAQDITWAERNDFYKADFVLEGQYLSAFYGKDGSLTAVTRNISFTQLPFALQLGFKKAHEGYWISNLIEVTAEDGIAYYITLENAETTLTLQSSAKGWSAFNKAPKI